MFPPPGVSVLFDVKIREFKKTPTPTSSGFIKLCATLVHHFVKVLLSKPQVDVFKFNVKFTFGLTWITYLFAAF